MSDSVSRFSRFSSVPRARVRNDPITQRDGSVETRNVDRREKPQKPKNRGDSPHAHLITTRATQTPCPRCRRPTLTAISEGWPVRADPEPLDRQGEINALLAGKWTWTLTQSRELIHRDPDRISDPKIRGTIHADHKCQPRPEQKRLF